MAKSIILSEMPRVSIPEIFYSDKVDEKFQQCNFCGKSLLGYESTYTIEKAFHRNLISKETELIYEYALCSKCQWQLSMELSEESLKNIQMYYQLYVDFDKRSKKLNKIPDFNINNWISNCIITGKPIAEEKEFSIGGLFYHDRLILSVMPFAIGEKPILEIAELLSKKTKDSFNRFEEKILPPHISNKIPDGRLILI